MKELPLDRATPLRAVIAMPARAQGSEGVASRSECRKQPGRDARRCRVDCPVDRALRGNALQGYRPTGRRALLGAVTVPPNSALFSRFLVEDLGRASSSLPEGGLTFRQ